MKAVTMIELLVSPSTDGPAALDERQTQVLQQIVNELSARYCFLPGA